MAKKVEVVDVSAIPAARKTLYLDIIRGRNKERMDWHLVITSDSIGLKLCKDTDDGKGLEDDAKKKLCSSQFATLSVAENFPDYAVGTDDYKKEMKEARTHFSSCINRALVSLGYRPKTIRAESNTEGATPVANVSAEAVQTALSTFSAYVFGLIHAAQEQAKATVTKIAEFQGIGKLSKVQTAAIGFIAEMAKGGLDNLNEIEKALENGKAPTTELDEKTMLAPKADETKTDETQTA